MSKKMKKETPLTKREVIKTEFGTIIAEPMESAAPEQKSKGRLTVATAARHLSALDSLLRRGVIDENRHAAEVAMLKARLG
jgi:hypothetical protein